MQQIIVDFGTLDFSDPSSLRFVVYGVVLVLLLVAGALAARRSRRRGDKSGSGGFLTLATAFALIALMLEFFKPKVPLRIFGYGLALVLGFLSGIYLAQWRARRAGEDAANIPHLGLLALIGGVVGARAAFVFEQFIKDPALAPRTVREVLDVPSGGLIYYGGLVLATALVLVFLAAKRLPARRFLDIVAPSVMVGLAFGRLGCLLNGCCFGAMARPDWAIGTRFPMYSKPLVKLDGRTNPYSAGTEAPSPPYARQMELARKTGRPDWLPDPRLTSENGRPVPPREFTGEQIAIAESTHSHPLKPAQMLGIINGMMLAGILIALGRLRTREGQVFGLMLVLYPITRFLLELIRADNGHDVARGVLTHNQYTSIFTVVAGIVFLAALRLFPASAGPSAPARAGAPADRTRQSERA